MKLVAQIAGGIFLAGLVSWIFWMSILAAAVPTVTKDVSQVLRMPTRPIQTQAAATIAIDQTPLIVTAHIDCINFVQMQNGERHCLVPQQRPGSAAR
jgi:hypothetical protein